MVASVFLFDRRARKSVRIYARRFNQTKNYMESAHWLTSLPLQYLFSAVVGFVGLACLYGITQEPWGVMPNVVRIMTIGRYDHMIAPPHLALCFVVCTLTVSEPFSCNVGDVYAVAVAPNLLLQRCDASCRLPHFLDLFVPIEVAAGELRLLAAAPCVHFVPRHCRLHGTTEPRNVGAAGDVGGVSKQVQNGLLCFLTNNASLSPITTHPHFLSFSYSFSFSFSYELSVFNVG